MSSRYIVLLSLEEILFRLVLSNINKKYQLNENEKKVNDTSATCLYFDPPKSTKDITGDKASLCFKLGLYCYERDMVGTSQYFFGLTPTLRHLIRLKLLILEKEYLIAGIMNNAYIL